MSTVKFSKMLENSQMMWPSPNAYSHTDLRRILEWFLKKQVAKNWIKLAGLALSWKQ
jgi:hypothetical protein